MLSQKGAQGGKSTTVNLGPRLGLGADVPIGIGDLKLTIVNLELAGGGRARQWEEAGSFNSHLSALT